MIIYRCSFLAFTDAETSLRTWSYSAVLVWTEFALLRFQRTGGHQHQHQCTVVVIFGLKRADCADEGLASLPRTLPAEINVLLFAGNLLERLEAFEFRPYASLQELSVVRNRIGGIDPDAFDGLHSLRVLDLEANNLSAVPTAAFRHVPSLRSLTLKANPIRYLTDDCFSGLANVEALNVEGCRLRGVHPAAFRGLDRLTELNIADNQLRHLAESMTFPSSLTVLRLLRNPWTCDCRLRWLRRRLTAKTVNWDLAGADSDGGPACAEPPILAGIAWRHVGWERFACPPAVDSAATNVRVRPGANVTVECVAVGDPEPRIEWGRDGVALPRSTFTLTAGSNELGDRQVYK